MATYTAQSVDQSGYTPTYNAAAGGGDKFPVNSRIAIKNGSGSPITATVVPDQTVLGKAIAAFTFTVAAGAEKRIGPFAQPVFGDANGLVTITWSSATSVTFSVEGN